MTTTTSADRAPARHRNEILLVGSVAQAPVARSLADGEEVVTFRLDVRLPPEAGGGRDTFDCTARGRTRQAALGWSAGDTVELTGAARRRFARAGGGVRPFTVVEVTRARRVSRPVRRRRTPG